MHDLAPGFPARLDCALRFAGYGDDRGGQARFAKALEVSSQAISQWRSGDTVPSARVMVGMAKCLGVSLDWLLMDRGNMIPNTGIAEEELAILAKLRTFTPGQRAKIVGIIEEIPPGAAEDYCKTA